MRHSFFHEEKKMFLSYFEWNEAMEGSVFYILYQYIYPTSDLPQTRRDSQFLNNNLHNQSNQQKCKFFGR